MPKTEYDASPAIDWKARHAHTKSNPGDFDCYANAMDDEPIFVLLARDVQAPAIIREWARRRKLMVLAGHKPKSDMEKVYQAYDCAQSMEDWRTHHDGVWREAPLLAALEETNPLSAFIGQEVVVTVSVAATDVDYGTSPDRRLMADVAVDPEQLAIAMTVPVKNFEHWDELKEADAKRKAEMLDRF